MKRAIVLVWLLVGILDSSASAWGQAVRGGFGASRSVGIGAGMGGTAGEQNRPLGARPTFNAPSAAAQRPRNHTQFFLPPAVPAPPRSVERFGLSSRLGNKFGIGHLESRRRFDFRRHPHFRHPHFWRGWRFVTLYVPGFIGTMSYFPASPLVTWNGWSEQGLPEYSQGSPAVRGPGRLAPFDPTPHEIVDRMLALAGITSNDVVYDLGAGDGRVLIAAAKNHGARGVGFELDPGLAKLARENAHKEGLENLVEIRQQDFMTADLSGATVVTLYLSYDGNLAVRPKLMREIKPGARVVSYTFDMAEWQPRIAESYRNAAGERHMLYMWQMSDPLVFSN